MDGIPDISTAELADILGVSVEELETATPVDPDDLARSSFEAMVAKQTGTPRAARSLRRLFADIDRADICMDALWAEPGRPTERTSVSRADARRAITAIDNRSLTEEVRTLHGTIHTVSDRRPLGLMVDGQSVAVATDELASDVIRSMRVGQQVTIDVIERVESGPQGERVTYTATGLTVSDDDAESSMTNDDHEGQ